MRSMKLDVNDVGVFEEGSSSSMDFGGFVGERMVAPLRALGAVVVFVNVDKSASLELPLVGVILMLSRRMAAVESLLERG